MLMSVVVFRAFHENRQTKQKRRTIELGNDNINLLVWCVSTFGGRQCKRNKSETGTTTTKEELCKSQLDFLKPD